MYNSFITGAAGIRDKYEFPLALSQANILKKHVTDFYTSDLIKKYSSITDFYTSDLIKKYFSNFDKIILFKKLLNRKNDLLSSKEVYSSKRLLTFLLMKKVFFKNANYFLYTNQNILGKVALELAEKYDAGMFLFAGNAYYAYKNDKKLNRPKGLIQYHPHIEKSSRNNIS